MTPGPHHILLIEDNIDHAELTRLSFKECRYDTILHHLTNGEDALDYLLRQNQYSDPASSPRPKIILLDLRLPKIDGLELLEKIKKDKKLCTIPVIILSTSNADADMLKSYESLANSYIAKPIDFKDFLAMAETICSFWLQWNITPDID
ncbi:MAG: response regulator [Candidatus Auribacterota bacterium]|jgi:CheY-like chemotaxis protein|nr:response regulator [Candidatus Auribacterota bacterium]